MEKNVDTALRSVSSVEHSDKPNTRMLWLLLKALPFNISYLISFSEED